MCVYVCTTHVRDECVFICVCVCVSVVGLKVFCNWSLKKQAKYNRSTNSNISYPSISELLSDHPDNNTQPTFTVADNSVYNFDMNMISKLNLLLN